MSMRIGPATLILFDFVCKQGEGELMCGRSASSRNQEKIRRACAYRAKTGKKNGKVVKPSWINCSSQKYYPSYNVSPQMNTPVMLSSTHSHIQNLTAVQDSLTPPSMGDLGERVLQPMKWGLVPNWRRTDQTRTPLLNNCRLEGILEKPSFRNAVERRRRCVVLADGFFEWHRQGRQKRPYFFHFRENKPTIEMEALEAVKEEEEDGLPENTKVESNVVNGRLLTMAGLFDICTETSAGEPLYSYSVITVEAHSSLAHIHDRMPAILEGDEAIQAWLDPKIPTKDAVGMLHPSPLLTWYPVSEVVNNVRNKTPECIMKIDPSKETSSKQKTLFSWFPKQGGSDTNSMRSQQQEDQEDTEESVAKRPKMED